MKFSWCTIMVNDMETSLKFYQEIIGLEITRRLNPEPGNEIVFLGKGETQIELIFSKNSQGVEFGKDISLGFEVDSLDQTIEFIQEKGISIKGGPFQPNPHVKFFYILDPNGLKIQFVQNM